MAATREKNNGDRDNGRRADTRAHRPYSIQTLKRLKPELFRRDLATLLDLLRQKKIHRIVAQRLPLAEARRAHQLLGEVGVTGKLVLVCDGAPG